MCGLYGAIGPNVNHQAIRTLALLNENRGRDGTGFFNSNFAHFKNVEKPSVWLKDPKVSKWLIDSSQKTWAICGHTRGGTRGGSCTKNAHPFRYGDIIGAHNGVIESAPAQYTVDSEWAMDMLSKHKPGAYQEALKGLAGWYMLTWLDRRDKCIYFLNWNGQLSLVNIGGTYYYSSDPEHLRLAMGVGEKAVHRLLHTQVLRFSVGKKGLVAEKLADFTGKDREVRVQQTTHYAGGGYGVRDVDYQNDSYWKARNNSGSSSKIETTWMEPTGFITLFPSGDWYCELQNKKFRKIKPEFQAELNKLYAGDKPGVSRWRLPIELRAQQEQITAATPLTDLPQDWAHPSGFVRKAANELKKIEQDLAQHTGAPQRAQTPSQIKAEVEARFPTPEQEESAKLAADKQAMDEEAAAVKRLEFHRSERLRSLTATYGLSHEEAHGIMVDEGYYLEDDVELVPVG